MLRECQSQHNARLRESSFHLHGARIHAAREPTTAGLPPRSKFGNMGGGQTQQQVHDRKSKRHRHPTSKSWPLTTETFAVLQQRTAPGNGQRERERATESPGGATSTAFSSAFVERGQRTANAAEGARGGGGTGNTVSPRRPPRDESVISLLLPSEVLEVCVRCASSSCGCCWSLVNPYLPLLFSAAGVACVLV